MPQILQNPLTQTKSCSIDLFWKKKSVWTLSKEQLWQAVEELQKSGCKSLQYNEKGYSTNPASALDVMVSIAQFIEWGNWSYEDQWAVNTYSNSHTNLIKLHLN
jgi:hypothetical protein